MPLIMQTPAQEIWLLTRRADGAAGREDSAFLLDCVYLSLIHI